MWGESGLRATGDGLRLEGSAAKTTRPMSLYDVRNNSNVCALRHDAQLQIQDHIKIASTTIPRGLDMAATSQQRQNFS